MIYNSNVQYSNLIKMKTCLLLIMLISSFMSSQNFNYFNDLHSADSLYQQKKYKDAGQMFDLAINYFGQKPFQDVLYNAACTWSLAGNKDKAFLYLEKIVSDQTLFSKSSDPVTFYNQLIQDKDFEPIWKDVRWKKIVTSAAMKKSRLEKNIDESLSEKILVMKNDDQFLRLRLDSLRLAKKVTPEEEKTMWRTIAKKDSMNVEKLNAIISQHGWPEPEKVGFDNSHTLFMVLQHASLDVQKKYFNLIKNAVATRKAFPDDFALLQDRINMRSKIPQIYGSQTLYDASSGYTVFPIYDVEHLDERRASAGLMSMSDYMKAFNLKWDLNEYKSKENELYGNYIKNR